MRDRILGILSYWPALLTLAFGFAVVGLLKYYDVIPEDQPAQCIECIERIDTLDTGLPRRVGSHRIDSITRDTLWDDQDRDEYQSKHNSFTRYFRIGTTCDSGRIYVTHWCTAVENLVIVGSFKTDTIWTNCADQQWEMKQSIIEFEGLH